MTYNWHICVGAGVTCYCQTFEGLYSISQLVSYVAARSCYEHASLFLCRVCMAPSSGFSFVSFRLFLYIHSLCFFLRPVSSHGRSWGLAENAFLKTRELQQEPPIVLGIAAHLNALSYGGPLSYFAFSDTKSTLNHRPY